MQWSYTDIFFCSSWPSESIGFIIPCKFWCKLCSSWLCTSGGVFLSLLPASVPPAAFPREEPHGLPEPLPAALHGCGMPTLEKSSQNFEKQGDSTETNEAENAKWHATGNSCTSAGAPVVLISPFKAFLKRGGEVSNCSHQKLQGGTSHFQGRGKPEVPTALKSCCWLVRSSAVGCSLLPQPQLSLSTSRKCTPAVCSRRAGSVEIAGRQRQGERNELGYLWYFRPSLKM